MAQRSPRTNGRTQGKPASLGALLVVLAALCWGLSGGIGGILISEGWSPTVVSLYRGLIGLVCVLIWLALRPAGSGMTSHRLWFWSVIAGIGVAGNFSFYFLSIAEGSVAVAATLMYSAPVFVYLASFAFGLERPTLFKWAAIATVMLGVILLTGIHDVGASDITLVAAGAGLLSGLSYATFIFAFKYAAPHGSPQAILVIAFVVLVGILASMSDAQQAAAVPGAQSWPLSMFWVWSAQGCPSFSTSSGSDIPHRLWRPSWRWSSR